MVSLVTFSFVILSYNVIGKFLIRQTFLTAPFVKPDLLLDLGTEQNNLTDFLGNTIEHGMLLYI